MCKKQVVSPLDIRTDQKGQFLHAFASFFGKHEMDVVARIIVELAQKKGSWYEFTLEEIVNHANGSNDSDSIAIGWHMLRDYKWVEKANRKGTKYHVCDEFIQRCKERSDARG